MRQFGELRPVWACSAYSGQSLPSRAVRLTFPSLLCHTARGCHDLYPAGYPSSLDGSSLGHKSLHHSYHGSAVPRHPAHWLQSRKQFRGGSHFFVLRPASWLERLTSPCRQLAPPTCPPVYGRACPSRGLPWPESAIATRPKHSLPRHDFHLQARKGFAHGLVHFLLSYVRTPFAFSAARKVLHALSHYSERFSASGFPPHLPPHREALAGRLGRKRTRGSDRVDSQNLFRYTGRMSENVSPLVLFANWFRNQDAEVRSDLAFLVGSCMPGEQDGAEWLSQPEKAFNAWIDEKTSPRRTLGKVLCVRGLVSLMGFGGRATQEDWDAAMQRNEAIIAKAEAEGAHEMAESIRQQLDEMPKRAKAWIRAATYWGRLCKGGLSDERIELWYRGIDIRRPENG